MSEYLSDQDRALCEKLGCFSNDSPWEEELARDAQARIRELSAKLAAAEADADRLAEAGASANNRWGYDERLARQLRRDLAPVVEFRAALAAHAVRKIDG